MTSPGLKFCGPTEVKEKLSKATVCLIDVREPMEYSAQKIEGTVNHPLSDLGRTIHKIPKDKEIILMCRSGRRSEQAADKLIASGITNIHSMTGGLDAWKAAGFPLQTAPSKVWELDRQVRFAAGSMILLGMICAWLVHPAWIALSVFVAGGLIFSAVTNTCGLAMMLAKMPWNRSK